MERVIQQRALLLKEDEDLLARTADSKALEDTLHRLREYMKQHAPGKLGAVDHDTAKRVRDDLAARLEILQALPESLPAAPTRKRKVKASAQDSSTDTEILEAEPQQAPDLLHEMKKAHLDAIGMLDGIIEQLR